MSFCFRLFAFFLRNSISLVIIFGISVVFWHCNSVFYYPTRDVYSIPDKKSTPYQEKSISLDQNQNICWWLFKGKNPKGTIVQFHGNAQNMSSHYLSVLWLRKHYNIITFDYRGYGCSKGKVSRENARQDGQILLRHILATKSIKRPIWLYGQSIGGIILMETALGLRAKEQESFQGMVLESTFSSYQKIARKKLSESWITWPFQWLGYVLVSDTGAPDKNLHALNQWPVLVVHSKNDPIVAFEFGKDIFEKVSGNRYGEQYGDIFPKQEKYPKWAFLPITEFGHINSFSIADAKYRNVLLEFLEKNSFLQNY